MTKLPGLGGWRRPQAELDESSRAAALESIVDLHTFDPGDLEEMARRAGAVEVSSATDEFTAAMLGWPVRTFESTVPPGKLGWGWAKFAFSSWTTLSWVDENVWRRVVPEGLVLQRDGDRGQAVVSVRPRRRRLSAGDGGRRRARARSTAYPLTDATRIADVAAVARPVRRPRRRADRDGAAAPSATAKFAGVDDWLFTDEALQQATATPVAAAPRAPAGRRDVHDVTCSIGTELAALRQHSRRRWAATSTRSGWRWRATTSPTCRCAGPTRCVPSAATPSCWPTPPDAADGRRRFDPRDYTPPLDAAAGGLP